MKIEDALSWELHLYFETASKKQITTTASEERLLWNPSGIPGVDCTDMGTITTIINSK